MSIQFGSTGITSNAQASFLQGAIVARHLPSADVTPFIERRKAYLPQGATSTTYQCSNNPHIPACRLPTDGCTGTGLPTDNTCATDLQVCNTITQTSNCATVVNC